MSTASDSLRGGFGLTGALAVELLEVGFEGGAEDAEPKEGVDANGGGLPRPRADGFATGAEKEPLLAGGSALAGGAPKPNGEGFAELNGLSVSPCETGLAPNRDGAEVAGEAPKGDEVGAPNVDSPAGAAKSDGAAGAPNGEETAFTATLEGSPFLGAKRDWLAAGAAPNARAGLSWPEVGLAAFSAGCEVDLSSPLAGTASSEGVDSEGVGALKRKDLTGAGAPKSGAFGGGVPKRDAVGGGFAGVVDGSLSGDFAVLTPKPAPNPAKAALGCAGSSVAGLASGEEILGADPKGAVLPNAEPADPNAELGARSTAGGGAASTPLAATVSLRDSAAC
jgi:hypothetical protein